MSTFTTFFKYNPIKIIIVAWIIVFLALSFPPLLQFLQPILFLLYLLLSLIFIFKSDYNRFFLLCLVALPFNQHFNFLDEISILSVFNLLIFIILIKEKAYQKTPGIIYISVFILYTLIISIGKVDLVSYLGGMSSTIFMFLYLVLFKVKIKPNIFKDLVYIQLIFVPVIIFQVLFPYRFDLFENRISGIVFQSNGYATLIGQYALLSVSIYLQNKQTKFLVISIVYCVLTFLTYSRSGFIGLVFCIYLIVLLQNYKLKLSFSVIVPLILIGVITFYISNSDFVQNSRYTKVSMLDVEHDRSYIWNDVLSQINKSKYIGLGVGNYQLINKQIVGKLSAHNTYLSLAVNFGYIGLTLILFFIFYLLVKLYSIMQTYRLNDSEISHLARTGFVCVVFLLMLGLTGSGVFSPYLSLITWGIVSVVFKTNKMYLSA